MTMQKTLEMFDNQDLTEEEDDGSELASSPERELE